MQHVHLKNQTGQLKARAVRNEEDELVRSITHKKLLHLSRTSRWEEHLPNR
jgi:hypothetical protein